MGRTLLLAQRYGSLVLILGLIATATTVTVSSCGSGGSSNGALCEQCGSTDGPCQDHGFVFHFPADSGVHDAEPCPTAASGQLNGCDQVPLICRRKSDSSQQRCFPQHADGSDPTNPDFNFRCDGSRPGGTAVPEPTDTLTPTPATTPVCGNGIIEGTEECDTGNLGGKTCFSVCGTSGIGTGLTCNFDCTLNVVGCGVPCPH